MYFTAPDRCHTYTIYPNLVRGLCLIIKAFQPNQTQNRIDRVYLHPVAVNRLKWNEQDKYFSRIIPLELVLITKALQDLGMHVLSYQSVPANVFCPALPCRLLGAQHHCRIALGGLTRMCLQFSRDMAVL